MKRLSGSRWLTLDLDGHALDLEQIRIDGGLTLSVIDSTSDDAPLVWSVLRPTATRPA